MDLKKLDEFINYKPIFSVEELDGYFEKNIVSLASKYLEDDQIKEIYKAYEFAKKAHGDVKRLSGEPYIVHPVRATEFLMQLKPDVSSIQACLLHDVIEDTEYEKQDIQELFGEEVAFLCEGMVKVSKVKYRGEDRFLETLKKTFIAMAQDLRVIFIKLADRIHNIQTLNYHPKPEKRWRIAMETMKVYVSIAKKLGLHNFQLLLENGVFRVLYPEDFDNIMGYLKKKFGGSSQVKDKGIKIISKVLKKEGLKGFEIHGRVKSPRRIYRKMVEKYGVKDVSKVLDVLAFRILVGTVEECYLVLGIVHKYWTPMINKIKDYIAVPKFNGYQSLHTTVLGIFKFPIEIQIRTWEMNEIAEYGVAAHFEYSDKGGSVKVDSQQGRWIRKLQEIVEKYQSLGEKEDFKQELNIEVLENNVFVYTPKGDVIELPKGSSVLDFAFKVHTQVGLKFKTALVNGEVKPINYKLKTGDVVEIKNFKNKYSVSKFWLENVVTSQAANAIKKYLKSQEKEKIIELMKKNLNEKLKLFGLPEYGSKEDLIHKKFSHEEFEKKLIAIYDKKERISSLIKEVYPQEWKKFIDEKTGEKKSKKIPEKTSLGHEIIVDDQKIADLILCPECNPKVGDKIIAKVGKNGIKIHKINCKAVKLASADKFLKACWENEVCEKYNVELSILTSLGKIKALTNFLGVISEANVEVDYIHTQKIDCKKDSTDLCFVEVLGEKMKQDKSTMWLITFGFSLKNPSKLGFILNGLKKYGNSIQTIKKKFI